jgi:hypothetical protein
MAVRNARLATDALLAASLMLARWFGSIEGSGEVPLGALLKGSGETTFGEK